MIGLDGRNHRMFRMVGLNKVVCDCVLWRSGSHCWYAGNWKSCNVCRIFSVKAIFETRESRPKFISSTREQNFQICPALLTTHTMSVYSTWEMLRDLSFHSSPLSESFWHFMHKASMTSLQANVHSADWLMSTFVNDFGSQSSAPCTQSTRSVSAAVPKNSERDFNISWSQRWKNPQI